MPGNRCARCGAILSSRRVVELESEARLEGFEPIGFRTRLEGFVCESCGLQQAPEHSFTATESGGASRGADALNDAVAKVGLK